MADEEILGPDSFGGSDFELERDDIFSAVKGKPMACAAHSWWIAVFVPKGADRNASNIFKITRVERFQAADKDMAFVQANRKTDWKLVSVAREEVVVY